MPNTPTLRNIQAAAAAMAGLIHRTPLIASRLLSQVAEAQVLLKAENLQRTGSFKIRGALAKLASLPQEQRAGGLIAASAGNHAQGVALAAQLFNIPCTVVMPRGASLAKVQATQGYGARVILEGKNLQEALDHAQILALKNRLTLVHPFDDPTVIAGQGTLGLEILEEAGELDMVIVPVGGGGLISGIALAVKEVLPRARVVGVQTVTAPGCTVSLTVGRPTHRLPRATLADGIAVSGPGQETFPLMQRYVDQMVTVTEEAIAHSQVFLLERAKLLVEGAGAVGVAALLEGKISAPGKRVVVVLSGGNVDLTLLDRVLAHGLAEAGRYNILRTLVLDQPGQLEHLLGVVANAGANVLTVEHQRYAPHLPIGRVEIEITLETRDNDHGEHVVRALRAAGYHTAGRRHRKDTPKGGLARNRLPPPA